MTDGRPAEGAHLDALMYRMLAGLLLLGAGVLLGLTLLLLDLPRIAAPGGALLVLPGLGGRHAIAATALPVLAAGTLLFGVPGLLAFYLGRRQARFGRGWPAEGRARSMRRPLVILLGGVVLLAVVLLRR